MKTFSYLTVAAFVVLGMLSTASATVERGGYSEWNEEASERISFGPYSYGPCKGGWKSNSMGNKVRCG